MCHFAPHCCSVEDAVWELSASARNEREFREKIDREFIKMKEKGAAQRERRLKEMKDSKERKDARTMEKKNELKLK